MASEGANAFAALGIPDADFAIARGRDKDTIAEGESVTMRTASQWHSAARETRDAHCAAMAFEAVFALSRRHAPDKDRPICASSAIILNAATDVADAHPLSKSPVCHPRTAPTGPTAYAPTHAIST